MQNRKNGNVISTSKICNTYADFNPDIDEVAAYGIGELIAGKILAKVGFFALILKFWKVIALVAVGAFVALRKKLFPKNELLAQQQPIEKKGD